MPIPSYRIAPGANRDIIPPISRGAALRQTSFAVRKVESRERPNMPHRHAAAPAPNLKSAFPRICPMNPEPAAAPVPNLKSTFPRIYPMNPEPAAAPAQNPESTFSRINPAASQPLAACFMTRMMDPSRRTYGFTRLPCPPTDLHLQTIRQAP
jgi:hypothetical protein